MIMVIYFQEWLLRLMLNKKERFAKKETQQMGLVWWGIGGCGLRDIIRIMRQGFMFMVILMRFM